ncbi:MAG: hypothetical protein ABL908_04970 [Hyphomicrobium sp.]
MHFNTTATGDIRRTIACAVIALSWGCGAASAQDAPTNEPRGFLCTFDQGSVATYDKGAFRKAAAAALSFELTEIDLDVQSAKLIASPGAAPGGVRVVRAINANHFLEVANEGFLNLTTIYDRDAATGAHPAVHSRHFGLIGQPVYTQYTGKCVSK